MINCSEYDYIEIACLYQYPVKLSLKSGQVLNGIALDTQRNEYRDECIKLNIQDTAKLIELDDIIKLEVLINNPHFTEITFS